MSFPSEDEDFIKYNTPVPCKFCGGGAGYAPIDTLKYSHIDVYFCHTCSAEYVFWGKVNPKNQTYSIYTQIGDRHFRVTVNSDNTCTIWFIGEIGVPGKSLNQKLKKIKHFNYIPDITPSNINQKLRSWLPFL